MALSRLTFLEKWHKHGQARSQDLENGGGGGGAILKDWEKGKRPWPEFSLFLNQFYTACPKIQAKFLGKLGNSKVFSAQNQVVSKKKKKGLRRNWDWFFGRIPKFKGFFRPKSGGLQKKKKGLCRNWDWFFCRIPKFKGFFRPKSGGLQKKKKKKKKKVFAEIETDFSAKFGNSNVWGGAVFLWGGLFSIFHKKIGLKSIKNVRFCILHKPMRGARAPPRPPPPPRLRYWTWHCSMQDKIIKLYFFSESSFTSNMHPNSILCGILIAGRILTSHSLPTSWGPFKTGD